ncbi:MAG: hypothetical protein A3F72_08120 [Bacteroidetes bacterium RIFCSPLOWO2_12_FULL_35_15]|nr:MAG: hypothetical protein A3F72_08120 [Bacteroidetes bacterium RIFCSPLOWO2_12_FULL_35_15]
MIFSNRVIFLLFFFSCFTCVNAQEKTFPDSSLQLQLRAVEKISETNYDSAFALTQTIIKTCIKKNKSYELAQAYNLAGFCQYFKSNYPLALEYYQKSEKIAEQYNYQTILLSLHNHMGTFYKKQNLLKEALHEFQNGAAVAEELNDSANIASFKNDIGLVYELDNKTTEALTNFQEALNIYKSLGNKVGMSYSLDYMGEAYALQNKFPEAIKVVQEALVIRKALNNQAAIAINLNNIGEIYFLQKEYSNAISYLLESEQISKKINYNDLRNHTLQLLAKCFYNLNEFKMAYDYFGQSSEIKDSLYSEKNSRIIHEMEGKYQNEKKQLQIESLNQQNELKETKLSKQRTTILLVLIAALLAGITVIFIFMSNRKIKKAHSIIFKQKEIVELAKHKVETQKELIEEKNKEILDSIHYAKRIQHAVITSDQYISKYIKDFFVLYKPKDIVSGDFYWALEFDNKFYLATADCTGHGVPGAFMSLLNISILNEVIIEKKITEPHLVLNEARKVIIKALNPEGQMEEGKDGMDCILACFDLKNNLLHYAAANNSFYIVRENKLLTFPADKMPVGKSPKDHVSFTLQTVQLQKGDLVYMLTDGYPDQFGGSKGKKFKYKPLEELFLEINQLQLEMQKNILSERFETWRGDLEQVDDVLIIGIKV